MQLRRRNRRLRRLRASFKGVTATSPACGGPIRERRTRTFYGWGTRGTPPPSRSKGAPECIGRGALEGRHPSVARHSGAASGWPKRVLLVGESPSRGSRAPRQGGVLALPGRTYGEQSCRIRPSMCGAGRPGLRSSRHGEVRCFRRRSTASFLPGGGSRPTDLERPGGFASSSRLRARCAACGCEGNAPCRVLRAPAPADILLSVTPRRRGRRGGRGPSRGTIGGPRDVPGAPATPSDGRASLIPSSPNLGRRPEAFRRVKFRTKGRKRPFARRVVLRESGVRGGRPGNTVHRAWGSRGRRAKT